MPAPLSIALLLVVTLAAVYDLRFRRIPNWLSLSGLMLGLGLNVLLGGGTGLRAAALGIGCALAVYLPLYLVRGMGAGDVKLMAAVGAMTGPARWFEVFLATALLGGVCALMAAMRRRRALVTLANVGLVANELLHGRSPAASEPRFDFRHRDALSLPHGAAIAGGCLTFLILHIRR